MKGALLGALLLASGPAAAAPTVPYMIGILGGRTVLVGWAFDTRGRPALELLDSASPEPVLVEVRLASATIRSLSRRKVQLASREVRLALEQGDLHLTMEKSATEVRVPLAKLISAGQDRLARECTPLSTKSAYCFRLAPGKVPGVNIWRQSDVWDFSAVLDPGAERPPKRSPLVPRPVRTVALKGPKARTVTLEEGPFRFTPAADGRSVTVETLPPQ